MERKRPFGIVLSAVTAIAIGLYWSAVAAPLVVQATILALEWHWLIMGVGLVVAGVFVLRLQNWARILLVFLLVLLCLNIALQFSFWRLSLGVMLHRVDAYVFPLTVAISVYLCLASVRALFDDSHLAVNTKLVLGGLFFVLAGVVRVTRIIVSPDHALWQGINLWVLPVDVALVITGLGLVLRNRIAWIMAMVLGLLVTGVALLRFIQLLPFIYSGPMLMLMEGGRGALHLNALFVIVTLHAAVLNSLRHRMVKDVLLRVRHS